MPSRSARWAWVMDRCRRRPRIFAPRGERSCTGLPPTPERAAGQRGEAMDAPCHFQRLQLYSALFTTAPLLNCAGSLRVLSLIQINMIFLLVRRAPMSRPDAQRLRLPPGMEVRGSLPPAHERAFGPDALAFVAELVRQFRSRVGQLLERRREMQRRYDGGERPNFLSSTEEIRASEWTVAPIPADLQDRRVEITGPT